MGSLGRREVKTVADYLRAPVTRAIVGLISVVYISQLVFGNFASGLPEVRHLLSLSIPDLARGQWWRVVTANLTNGQTAINFGPPGFGHFSSNAAELLALGPPVERGLGRGRFLLVAVVSGIVAYGWVVLPNPAGIYQDGTSAVVYGIGGALVVLVIRRPPIGVFSWMLLAVAGAGGIVGVVAGPDVTTELHSGGFVAGALVALACLVPTRRYLGWVAGGALVVGVAVLLAVRVPALEETSPQLVATIPVHGLPAALGVSPEGLVVQTERPSAVGVPGSWSQPDGPRRSGAVLRVGDSVWATNIATGTVYRYGPGGALQETLHLGRGAWTLSFDGQNLWIAGKNYVWRVMADSGRVTAVVHTGVTVDDAVVDQGSLWLLDQHDRQLVAVGLHDLIRRWIPIPISGLPDVLATGPGGRLWVATTPAEVACIDPGTGREFFHLDLPGAFVTDLASGAGNRIWVADFRDQLFALDAATGSIEERVRLGLSQPTALAIQGGTLWDAAYWQSRVLEVRLPSARGRGEPAR